MTPTELSYSRERQKLYMRRSRNGGKLNPKDSARLEELKKLIEVGSDSAPSAQADDRIVGPEQAEASTSQQFTRKIVAPPLLRPYTKRIRPSAPQVLGVIDPSEYARRGKGRPPKNKRLASEQGVSAMC